MQGIKRDGVAGIQIHDQREKGRSHTNKDIDFGRSHLNYDLHNIAVGGLGHVGSVAHAKIVGTSSSIVDDSAIGHNASINFTEKINERIAQLNLKRAIRKDANIMAQIFISASPE